MNEKVDQFDQLPLEQGDEMKLTDECRPEQQHAERRR